MSWHKEPRRHSLARMGVKTATKDVQDRVIQRENLKKDDWYEVEVEKKDFVTNNRDKMLMRGQDIEWNRDSKHFSPYKKITVLNNSKEKPLDKNTLAILNEMKGSEVYYKDYGAVGVEYPYIWVFGEKKLLSNNEWRELEKGYWENPDNEGWWINLEAK